MDFAPESVRDAFPPPQTRQAQGAAAPTDDTGRSFDDHLEAVNEPRPERAAPPQVEARDESAAPVDARSTETDTSNDEIDPDAALLGGPLPPAPPQPMPAPIVIQIAASQPEQAPQSQAQPDDTPLAPLSTPQAPQLKPEQPDLAATADPAAPSEPTTAKANTVDAKDVAPKAAVADAPPAQPDQSDADAALVAAQQAATAPTTPDDLPQAMQQVIAATVAPAQTQTNTQSSTRPTKDTTQAIEAKPTDAPRDGKVEAPTPNTKARTNAAPSNEGGKLAVEATPTPQTSSAGPNTSDIAENSAISTTASQASTHVQHASAETGAQRAAPATAQVGREIVRRFNGGTTNFELRLDPADLGRVEVKLEVTRDHRVTAVITADNPQALTELARGARELEQQLQSAGLQLSENGLSFDLRQGSQGGDGDQQNNSNARGDSDVSATTEQQQAPVARPIGYERWRGVRVDMMV